MDITTPPSADPVTVPESTKTDAAQLGGMNADKQQARAAAAIRQSVAFAQIVSVLARSPAHKFFTLADLEWLVVPPLKFGQFAVAEAKGHPDSPPFPVAVVLWASVASEVDRSLSENLGTPIRLRPDEWRSGKNLWLVDAVGDDRVLRGLLQQLLNTSWKDCAPKMRSVGADGKIEVTNVGSAVGTPAKM